MDSILIVGGSGTLGKKLCHEISLNNLPFKATVCCRKPQPSLENIRYIVGNLDDRKLIDQVITTRPAQIIFCASAYHPRASIGKAIDVMDMFILPSLSFLSSILRHCRPKKFIFLSSYYGINNSFYFGGDMRQHTPYSMEKLVLESSLYTMCSEVGCKLAILRLANIFSPDEIKTDFGVINVFSRLIAENLEDQIKIIDGNIAKDYFHVDDFLSLLIRVMSIDLPSSPNIFNAGSGCAVTPLQILSAIKQIHGSRKSAPIIPCSNVSFDISLLKETFGWSPSFTISDIIATAYLRYAHCKAKAV